MDEEVLKEYRTVQSSAGWRELSYRGKVKVTGPDRVSFLHSMISNEVEGLNCGEGRYGTFLTATGKILADFYYYRFPEFLLIDIAADILHGFMEKLRKYIIMDDVELEDISEELGHFSVEGPEASDLLEGILGLDVPAGVGSVNSLIWRDQPLLWIRKDELEKPGFEIILPNSISPDFRAELTRAGRSHGLVKIGPEAYELLRLERGIPLNGIDFTEKNNPVEARLENAYSLSKGCYVGQEVVSKATYVGSVAKALSKLKIEGQVVPERGARVLEEGGKEIGRITSAVLSLQLQCPIALAFLKKGFWAAGLIHRIEIPSHGLPLAEVVEQFQAL